MEPPANTFQSAKQCVLKLHFQDTLLAPLSGWVGGWFCRRLLIKCVALVLKGMENLIALAIVSIGILGAIKLTGAKRLRLNLKNGENTAELEVGGEESPN